MTKVILATHGTSGIPEFAGSTWVRLQYMLGLQRLDVDVYWVDRLRRIDPHCNPHSIDYLARRFDHLAESFGFKDRYCIVYDDGARYFGMSAHQLEQLARATDLVINISGRRRPLDLYAVIPRRAFVDVDPGFTQIWALQMNLHLDWFNFHFTIGQTVGKPEFPIPVGKITWRSVLPPVVLDQWPTMADPSCQRFSTVADWRSRQDALHNYQYYGGKREEFLDLLHVPVATGATIEIALCIDPVDSEDIWLLTGNSWILRDPYQYAGDPWSYREYIQFSRAEFSVAKRGYVRSNSGWISDRTACYLASGKPALVQSTGLESYLPTGKGLLTFRTAQEAVNGIHEINRNYLEHSRHARMLAEQRFDSDKVLRSMLDQVGL